MLRFMHLLLPAGVLTAPMFGAEPVTVTKEIMEFTVRTAETAVRGQRSTTPKEQRKPGYYPVRGTEREVKEKVEIVKLRNGYVEAWVVPAWGARLIRAFDVKTKVDYFKWYGLVADDILPWSKPGGVKASFPFFEHGLHLRQPAGWRVVRHDDGAVSIAMHLRFTQYQSPAEMDRYGRYGDEPLSILVTLRPGSSVVEWHQRKDNPNPLPRGARMWNDALLPTAFSWKTDAELSEKEKRRKRKNPNRRNRAHRRRSMALTTYLFPARWVTDHGPTTIHSSPHWSNPDNWNISHFAIDAPYGFVGVYIKPTDVNHLRINDPQEAPAAKLYTCDYDEFCEYWGGAGYVFERTGPLFPAYKPIAFTHYFYIAQGLGPVTIANRHVAAAVSPKGELRLLSTRAANLVAVNEQGTRLAAGRSDPHTPVIGKFTGKTLVVALDGKEVLRRNLPLARPVPAKDEVIPPEIRKRYEWILSSHTLEADTVGRNQGAPGVMGALNTNARVAYRFGRFELAERLLANRKDGDAQLVRALIAWERGKPDFSGVDWRAAYHQALLAVQNGDRNAAVAHVKTYLANVPDAWRPRLALTFWTEDKALAARLVEENPASPEALLVLSLLGDREAAAAVRALAPDAHSRAQVEAFRLELTKGIWRHAPRYRPLLEGQP